MEYTSIQKIIDAIRSPGIAAVSFDVFDTLILRPVADDYQKFGLLDRKFGELSSGTLAFSDMRRMAEEELRRKIRKGLIEKEDVSINEIYQAIRSRFMLPEEIASAMMEEEFAVEKLLCRQRKSGKTLYDAAVAANKTIIITTDMYLRGDQIHMLLTQCGYEGYDYLFVSSEEGKRKTTGSLYREICDQTGILPLQILHIGDDPAGDIAQAEREGFRTAYLPKTTEAFAKQGCFNQVQEICRDLTDWETAQKEPGIAIFRKMAADRYFDDPFRPFEKNSAYNADAYFVGYAALGMHVLALVKWLAENVQRDHVKKLLFLSRDGFLPMQVYEAYRQYHPELPPCGYLYASRLALLPVMMKEPRDLFGLPVDLSWQTPKKLLKILEFCSVPDAEKWMWDATSDPDETFTNESFTEFISVFMERTYDKEKHEQSRQRVRDYLLHNPHAFIEDGTAVFDSGYSGRSASAIQDAAGKDIVHYYFQGNGAGCLKKEAATGIRIRAFFDFSPYMEPAMREYAYLEPAPSCIGYSANLTPRFDIGPAKGYKAAADRMQDGAMDFVKDYLRTFAGYEKQTGFRYHNAAMPFEAFLRFCSGKDRELFAHVMFDDELWGGRRDIDLERLMTARIGKLPDYARSEEEESLRKPL